MIDFINDATADGTGQAAEPTLLGKKRKVNIIINKIHASLERFEQVMARLRHGG